MTHPSEVQRRALDFANDSFQERVDDIIAAADGDTSTLSYAAAEVAKHARTAGTPEHIAYTYIAAAFKQAAEASRRTAKKRARSSAEGPTR